MDLSGTASIHRKRECCEMEAAAVGKLCKAEAITVLNVCKSRSNKLGTRLSLASMNLQTLSETKQRGRHSPAHSWLIDDP